MTPLETYLCYYSSRMKTSEIVTVLRRGGVVVMRTDTIYGLLARAADAEAVKRLYQLKGRHAGKPFIQLITQPDQAFGDSRKLARTVQQYTDRPTSVIVDTPDAPAYLVRRGTNLAYRLIQSGTLYEIIQQTGALVAPSANPEGMPPARRISEAQAYFGGAVDLYVDGGTVPADTLPSRLVTVAADGTVTVLRD